MRRMMTVGAGAVALFFALACSGETTTDSTTPAPADPAAGTPAPAEPAPATDAPAEGGEGGKAGKKAGKKAH